MSSFFQSAGRTVHDVRVYLDEASAAGGLRYKGVRGERHRIYIPTIVEQVIVDGQIIEKRVIEARSGSLHGWKAMDSSRSYKETGCLKDYVRYQETEGKIDKSILLNDGTCPFCDTVDKGWQIYNYRIALEERLCTKHGDEYTAHMDAMRRTFGDERKTKAAKNHLYLLIVMFRTKGGDISKPILDDKGIPEFDLKVMRITPNRLENIRKTMINSGLELEGSELVFDYPDEDDPRLVVSNSTVSPVFGGASFVERYPAVKEAIDEAVKEFKWTGIEKYFTEWAGLTSVAAREIVDGLYAEWDKYVEELKVNPNAVYLEYVGLQNNGTNPELNAVNVSGNAPRLNNAPAPGETMTAGMTGIEGAGVNPNSEVVNKPKFLDANKIFGDQPVNPDGTPMTTKTNTEKPSNNTINI